MTTLNSILQFIASKIPYITTDTASSTSASVGSNSVFTVYVTAPEKSGYTCIGVTSIGTNHSQGFYIGCFYWNGNTVKVDGRNTSGSAVTLTVTAKFLYIKN